MGLPSAMVWWEEWQLRILLLSSQSVQWILFLSARRRKSGISAPSRVLIWLAYLGSDAMAIYALAAIFYRQSKNHANPSFPHGNGALEAVWAPVLLMHLGGQCCITAYNMEDNELWRRHALIAVSQITVAIYVFCRSWEASDEWLAQAAIMLLTLGGIRCLGKPFALKKASIGSLASSFNITAKPSGNKGSSTQINSQLQDYVNSLWAHYKAVDLAEEEEERRRADLAKEEERRADPARAEKRRPDQAETRRRADAEAKGVQAGVEASSPYDTSQAEGIAEDRRRPSDEAEVEDDIEANLGSVRARADGDRPSGKAQAGGGVEARSLSDTEQVQITELTRPSDTAQAEASSPSDIAQGEGIIEPIRPSDTARPEASSPSDTAEVKGITKLRRPSNIARTEASRPSDTAQAEGVAEDIRPSNKAEVEDDAEANLESVRARADVDRPSGKSEVGGSVEESTPSDTAQIEAITEPSRPSDTARAETSTPSDTSQVEASIEASRPSDTARAEASCPSDTIQVQGITKPDRPSNTARAEDNGGANRPSGYPNREVDAASVLRATYDCSNEEVRGQVNQLFVDLASPYSDRLVVTRAFLSPSGKNRYELLQERLSDTFDLLYTKALPDVDEDDSCFMFLANIFRVACIILPFAAIGLFHRSNREAYDDNDVKVTYILLWCTAVMELVSHPSFVCKLKLSGSVAQYSFMGFFTRNKKYTVSIFILRGLGCKEYVNQQFPMKPVNSSSEITMLVHQQVKGWWKQHIRNAADYARFNNTRGQWAIQEARLSSLLGWSIEMPFDESVLLWHIATDLCFHNMGVRSMNSYKAAKGCREISNYMVYLLFVKPEMLMAGTRPNLLRVAYEEFNKMVGLRWREKAPVDERDIAQKLVANVENSPNKGYFVHYAWDLAKVLSGLNDQTKMWEVIQGVWVEMLCYSASRCRGYLHAQSLGTGGELLTFVWLLWSHMGMETLAEKMQMPAMEHKNGL